MQRLRALNPYTLGPTHPDPAIRIELAHEYARREHPLTYSAQGIALLTVLIGVSLQLWWVVAIGVLRFCMDGTSRVLMRRFTVEVDAGRMEPAIRRRVVWYLCSGFVWAMVSWPFMVAPPQDRSLAILPVIATVSPMFQATSSCMVSRFYTATCVGFTLGLLPVSLAIGKLSAIVMLASLPALMAAIREIARNIRDRFVDMVIMQAERDKAIAVQARVIEDLGAAREHATRLAATDSVTALPNRQAFLDHLDDLVDQCAPFTLVLVDVDYFKNINDAMGHHVGDAVLVAISDTLNELEPTSTFIARQGGDELALVLPTRDSAELPGRFATWLDALSQLPVPGIGTLAASVTAGSARFPEDAGSRRDILNAADMALRSAKNTLRGTYRAFSHDMTGAFNQETLIARRLSTSIEERLFAVYVQPLVRMTDGSLVGGELLTRFIDPDLAEFPVQAVFDVAEERGLGRRLSDVLLTLAEESILTLGANSSDPTRVAVNLSPTALKLPELLLDRLAAWIRRGVDPSRVTLEITEDAISGRGLGHMNRTLTALSGMGYTLALDDFGTGHSSLAHLHTLPIEELKIPKEFVESVAGDRKDQAIVRSAVAMCEHLGIRCVVEGVETPAQREALLSLGATVGQGHLWSVPMPLEEYAGLLREQQARNRTVAGRAPVTRARPLDHGVNGLSDDDAQAPDSAERPAPVHRAISLLSGEPTRRQ